MAKKTKKRKPITRKKRKSLPFTRKNYQIFGIGILILIIGYIFLSIGPEDSFFTRTLGPVILVIGYCIVIPLSILYREKRKPKTANK